MKQQQNLVTGENLMAISAIVSVIGLLILI